jgi:hypothetical protein
MKSQPLVLPKFRSQEQEEDPAKEIKKALSMRSGILENLDFLEAFQRGG